MSTASGRTYPATDLELARDVAHTLRKQLGHFGHGRVGRQLGQDMLQVIQGLTPCRLTDAVTLSYLPRSGEGRRPHPGAASSGVPGTGRVTQQSRSPSAQSRVRVQRYFSQVLRLAVFLIAAALVGNSRFRGTLI